MRPALLCLLSALSLLNTVLASNKYCSGSYSSLCTSYDRNLCKAKEVFIDSCPKDAELVYLNSTVVLDFINDKRKLVANGELNGLKSASKMNQLLWCKELALVAEHSVYLCNQTDAFCPRTTRFQNARLHTREYPIDPDTEIDISFLNKWWHENKHTNMDDIKYFTDKKDAEGYAYFTNDRTTHIGCSAARYTRYSSHKFLFACVFSHSPNYSKPYAEGSPASTCTSGVKSKQYQGLCSVSADEKIKANDVC